MARVLRPGSVHAVEWSWEITALPPGQAQVPGDLDALHLHWTTCAKPMTVAAALRDAGLWDLDRPRDFDAEDWWYRCRFTASAAARPRRLRFEGLATVADVWLNRVHVLRSDSMFTTHVVDVDSILEEQNELIICFHALSPLLAARGPRPRWRSSLVSHQALRRYRTTLLGRMPGWCPPVAPVGPWRPVLIEDGPLAIEHADIRTELDGSCGVVKIVLAGTAPCEAVVAGTVAVGTRDAQLSCERSSPTRWELTAAVRVPNPDRWWPHTHGTPALYPVRACIVAGGRAETIDLGRVGFRTVEIDRGPNGQGFSVIINDAPVFCRGVCWTPLDLAGLSGNSADYQSALEQLRDAGMNMVRIGGTMVYETDAFHDWCDELGILVWQDLMFASMDYPWEDDAFARSAVIEARQTLTALQSRPSLAVVCGSSEVEQQPAMLGLPAARRSNPAAEGQLAALVQEIAPGVAWVPTTPSGGTFPFHVDVGVSHYYGVGAYCRPFEDARRAGVRFAAECLAFSNVPDPTTVSLVSPDQDSSPQGRWKRGVPRDAGADRDFEDVRDHYVERLFGVSAAALRASDPARYLALGRVATGEAMLRTFTEWRRPGSTCRGGLVWFARDLCPGAGWGIVDSCGRLKAAYWYLKRVLAPVALLMSDEGLNGLWIHAVNDTARRLDVDLRVALYRGGRMRGVPAHAVMTVPSRGHCSVHADALFDGFLDLTYAYRFGPPGHDVVAATLRDRTSGALHSAACFFPAQVPSEIVDDMGLAARLEAADGGYALALETRRFAHGVAIDVDGWMPDDNYLHLEPGQTRRVKLRSSNGGGIPHGSVSALNGRGSVALTMTEAVHAN